VEDVSFPVAVAAVGYVVAAAATSYGLIALLLLFNLL
jgi:hypothetical protein